MIIASLADGQAELQSLIATARHVVAFTGAGISTECGVPDFRSPGSPWLKNQPIDFADFLADPLMREEAWRRKFVMDDLYAHAKPGRGHRALARLIAAGRMSVIITQNIDGLHQACAVPDDRVIELHGNGTYARCLGCGRRYELKDVRRDFEATGAAPQCDCGGYIKSATISFGQAMPEAAMRRAEAETTACDLFLAIGSSLVVYPAAGFPLSAKRCGASLVIVNNAPTPLDESADLVVRGDIGDFLEPFAA
ncbi:MAG: NAD-dependent protein deacetylase [Beijerinckiaceae bacterium]